MIRAVALYVDGEGPPPPELEYWFMWETFGALPNSGGLRDQRAGELQRMRKCKEVFDTWLHFREQKEGWERLPIDEPTASLFRDLKDLLDE
jgi:hypothetical protein